MSSCKKWNSCNNNCKRSGSNRGGGGGNGVIGKDGATGPTGPAGLQGPTGPAPSGLNGMIPYEPYNQNNSVSQSISLPSAITTTYIQFIAPSTGYYTKARVLTNEGPLGPGNLANITLRLGIYDNSDNYVPDPPLSTNPVTNHGIPYQIEGQGSITIAGPDLSANIFKYIDVTFDQSANLIMNEPYWFVYSTYALDTSGNPAKAEIFDQSSFTNGNDFSILDISDNTIVGGSTTSFINFPTSEKDNLRTSSNPIWFRLYDPSASFIVGPTGDCGCTGAIGATGATGPTGPAASAFKSYDYGVHVMPSTALDASKVILGMDSLLTAGGAIAVNNTSMTVTLRPTIDVLGWIYPSYGGIAQLVRNPSLLASNVNQSWPNGIKNLNWSDRSSFPTGSWYGGSEGASGALIGYADAIARSIDTDVTIDENSMFSWMFGPYDGGNIIGQMVSGRKMSLYIVYIPCTNLAGIFTPASHLDWQWIRIVFNGNGNRCDCKSLSDLSANVGIGPPTDLSGANTGSPIIGNSINIKCGGSLGICIGSNDINYTNTCSATNQPFLISPATFSLKVKQT